MWQGILTHTYGKESGSRPGLVITMDEKIGAPNPDPDAALREAEAYLERAQKAKPEGETLEICIRHISYDPANTRTGIELIFR